MDGEIRIGIDTGGTFTDFHLVGRGTSLIHKVPSTPDDPARAVVTGLREIASHLGNRADGTIIVHGTTVGTNALLTRQVARTAFVTTAGFEDLIEIGRQSRERLYDLDIERPNDLVPRALRFGVHERVRLEPDLGRPPSGGRGRSPKLRRTRPSRRELAGLSRRLRAARVEAVAIGFLHSYLEGANEMAVGRALASLGVPVTLSHRIAGEYREYERFATAVANAALSPLAGRYVARLSSGARGARLWILQSDGTTANAASAASEPVRTVLSGPAGGALAAIALARRRGDRRVLAFDMGGTSTDAVLIDGELPHARATIVAGVPLRVPMIDMRTVGAGGGSIARRDEGGALRVGPESAGADPGPACYGRGTAPTVTDAHIVLGRLGESDLLGGRFRIDPRRSAAALGRLARELRLRVPDAAEGVLRVVEATMARTLKQISLEQGKDPRKFTLYASGGAGGLHACALAEALGITSVVIPPGPGVFSATGLAAARPGVEVSATVLASPRDRARLARSFSQLRARALARLREQGIRSGGVRIERFADLRYAGQSHEITVADAPDMARRFARAHRARYGHTRPGAAVEVVTLRLRAVHGEARAGGAPGLLADAVVRTTERRRGTAARVAVASAAAARASRARVVIAGRRRWCGVVPRDALRTGKVVPGPARITEYSGTTFVPPDWRATVGEAGELILTPLRARHAPGRTR